MLTFKEELGICLKLLIYYMAEPEESWGNVSYRLFNSINYWIQGVFNDLLLNTPKLLVDGKMLLYIILDL